MRIHLWTSCMTKVWLHALCCPRGKSRWRHGWTSSAPVILNILGSQSYKWHRCDSVLPSGLHVGVLNTPWQVGEHLDCFDGNLCWSSVNGKQAVTVSSLCCWWVMIQVTLSSDSVIIHANMWWSFPLSGQNDCKVSDSRFTAITPQSRSCQD